MKQELPVSVLSHPHWRVLLRPSAYSAQRIAALADCLHAVERAQVRLRGWPFPPLSRRLDQREYGQNWLAAWMAFGGHLEYWRFFQSSQFVYLGGVREVVETAWDEKIRANISDYIYEDLPELDKIPGFVSLPNLVYNLTEYCEFAARLCEAGVYEGNLELRIALRGAQRFVLVADPDWAPLPLHQLGRDDLEFRMTVPAIELVANARAKAVEATVWFLERFGWLKPPVHELRAIQDSLRGSRAG